MSNRGYVHLLPNGGKYPTPIHLLPPDYTRAFLPILWTNSFTITPLRQAPNKNRNSVLIHSPEILKFHLLSFSRLLLQKLQRTSYNAQESVIVRAML
jgi:hypothetical protein